MNKKGRILIKIMVSVCQVLMTTVRREPAEWQCGFIGGREKLAGLDPVKEKQKSTALQ